MMAKQHRYQCPCCGHYTLKYRGGYDICPVCFWEDSDGEEVYDLPSSRKTGEPNLVLLEKARENFLAFGAAEEKDKGHVRPPHEDELPSTN
jgi:Cysteine-rich CPCC